MKVQLPKLEKPGEGGSGLEWMCAGCWGSLGCSTVDDLQLNVKHLSIRIGTA